MPSAENDGIRIRYKTEGSGPPLVLHIGFMGALEDWADAGYVDALRDRYRLILIDPRGQGRNDKPHDLAAYAESNRVGDVLAVLDAEGIERAHFWGYSLGGWVGFTLGATAPHRLRSLIVGGADPFRRVDRDLDSDPFILALRKGVHTLVTEFEADDSNYWVSPGERQRWLASDAAALIAARTQWLSEPNMTEDAVAAIQTRTLIYVGSEDRPDGAERTANLMPRATFVLLDSLDHAAGFGRTDLVLPRVEQFLAENVGDSNGSD